MEEITTIIVTGIAFIFLWRNIVLSNKINFYENFLNDNNHLFDEDQNKTIQKVKKTKSLF